MGTSDEQEFRLHWPEAPDRQTGEVDDSDPLDAELWPQEPPPAANTPTTRTTAPMSPRPTPRERPETDPLLFERSAPDPASPPRRLRIRLRRVGEGGSGAPGR